MILESIQGMVLDQPAENRLEKVIFVRWELKNKITMDYKQIKRVTLLKKF